MNGVSANELRLVLWVSADRAICAGGIRPAYGGLFRSTIAHRADRLLVAVKVRPDIGAPVPADVTDEPRLDIGRPQIVSPSIRHNSNRVAAVVLRLLGQPSNSARGLANYSSLHPIIEDLPGDAADCRKRRYVATQYGPGAGRSAPRSGGCSPARTRTASRRLVGEHDLELGKSRP